jgi:hypothetical protein
MQLLQMMCSNLWSSKTLKKHRGRGPKKVVKHCSRILLLKKTLECKRLDSPEDNHFEGRAGETFDDGGRVQVTPAVQHHTVHLSKK